MSNDAFREAEVFFVRDGIFGAFDADSAELVLVVEAGSIDEAITQVRVVAPLIGVDQSVDLIVEQLVELPSRVPTFLRAFFEAGKIAVSAGNVALGTNSHQ